MGGPDCQEVRAGPCTCRGTNSLGPDSLLPILGSFGMLLSKPLTSLVRAWGEGVVCPSVAPRSADVMLRTVRAPDGGVPALVQSAEWVLDRASYAAGVTASGSAGSG